jgi:hypothetical protein
LANLGARFMKGLANLGARFGNGLPRLGDGLPCLLAGFVRKRTSGLTLMRVVHTTVPMPRWRLECPPRLRPVRSYDPEHQHDQDDQEEETFHRSPTP